MLILLQFLREGHLFASGFAEAEGNLSHFLIRMAGYCSELGRASMSTPLTK